MPGNSGAGPLRFSKWGVAVTPGAVVFEEDASEDGALAPAVSRGEGPDGAASFGRGWGSGETGRWGLGPLGGGGFTWVICNQHISVDILLRCFQKAQAVPGYRGPRLQDPKLPGGP